MGRLKNLAERSLVLPNVAQTRTAIDLSGFFASSTARQPLTRDEEASLALKIGQGCRQARNRLVESNLAFAVKVACEYRNLGLPLEDLLNEGCLGLIEAARRFDPSNGTKFITYATWWIRKAIRDSLSRYASLVRVPSYQKRKMREVREVRRRLERNLGRAPGFNEISAEMQESAEGLGFLLSLGGQPISLDEQAPNEDRRSVADNLPDPASGCAETTLIQEELERLVDLALEQLTQTERIVVQHRFGIDDMPQLTLRELGAMLKLSRERIRQIEGQAQDRLRKMLTNRKFLASAGGKD